MPDCIIVMVMTIMLKTMMNVDEANPDKTIEESTKDKRTVASRIKIPGINSGSKEKIHITLAERTIQRKIFGSLPKPSISISGVKK
jgi:hypothetical protein